MTDCPLAPAMRRALDQFEQGKPLTASTRTLNRLISLGLVVTANHGDYMRYILTDAGREAIHGSHQH